MAYNGLKSLKLDVEPLFPITVWTSCGNSGSTVNGTTSTKNTDSNLRNRLLVQVDNGLRNPLRSQVDHGLRNSLSQLSIAEPVGRSGLFNGHGNSSSKEKHRDETASISSITGSIMSDAEDWRAVKKNTSPQTNATTKSSRSSPIKPTQDFIYEWLKAAVIKKENVLKPELLKLISDDGNLGSCGKPGQFSRQINGYALIKACDKWNDVLKRCYSQLSEMCLLCKGFQSNTGYCFDALPKVESYPLTMDTIDALMKLCFDLGGVLEYVMAKVQTFLKDRQKPEYTLRGNEKPLLVHIEEALRSLIAYNQFWRVVYHLFGCLMASIDVTAPEFVEIDTMVALLKHLETLLGQARLYVTHTFERIWVEVVPALKHNVNLPVFSDMGNQRDNLMDHNMALYQRMKSEPMMVQTGRNLSFNNGFFS